MCKLADENPLAGKRRKDVPRDLKVLAWACYRVDVYMLWACAESNQ